MSKQRVPQSTIYLLDKQLKVLGSTWRYTRPYRSVQSEKDNDVLDIDCDLSIDANLPEQVFQILDVLEAK